MEEEISWYDKVSDAINEATESARDTINDILDKVTGKESSLEVNLDDVGLALGEEKKYSATGNIRVSLSFLK